MQQDRKNTARQSIWSSELCRYLEVQSIRSSDLQVWLKSCSRQHDIAPSHFKCDELLIDVLKRELELASQNSPQEYRLCLQLGYLGVILAHFDKSLSSVALFLYFPYPQSCHFNWCLAAVKQSCVLLEQTNCVGRWLRSEGKLDAFLSPWWLWLSVQSEGRRAKHVMWML